MCGAVVRGGDEACQKLFDEVLAFEYSDPSCGAVHLFSVDCYALQHSEAHRPYSNAFHLLRLGWFFERDKNPKLGKTDLEFKRYAKNLRDFPYLAPPKDRGGITVADIVGCKNPEAHEAAVRQWAQSVWQAWRAHHGWVRQKLDA